MGALSAFVGRLLELVPHRAAGMERVDAAAGLFGRCFGVVPGVHQWPPKNSATAVHSRRQHRSSIRRRPAVRSSRVAGNGSYSSDRNGWANTAARNAIAQTIETEVKEHIEGTIPKG